MKGWRWQGSPGHFICGDRCVFHLCTVVGEERKYLVSTIGEYDGAKGVPKEVGVGRLYETMVFRAAECDRDDCNEWHQADAENLDFEPANDRKTAEDNHMSLATKWSKR